MIPLIHEPGPQHVGPYRLTQAAKRWLSDPQTVLHWYDFLCPFCYIAQSRNDILRHQGFAVVELPFDVHRDIPLSGTDVGTRHGPMYAHLNREAKDAGLILNWPSRLPNTRLALAAAEWVRREHPDAFPQFQKRLFAAHFVRGENLGDMAVIDRYIAELKVDVEPLHAGLRNGNALAALNASEALARQFGVRATPAWLIRGRLISGLLSSAEFSSLVSPA